jgi:uncharacterized protein (TIGR02246 family)
LYFELDYAIIRHQETGIYPDVLAMTEAPMKRACFAFALVGFATQWAIAQQAAQNNLAPDQSLPAADQPAARTGEPAASPTAAEARSPEDSAIRKNAAAYVEAYNARNAKALAALWSPDAVYMDPDTGAAVAGRQAIEEYFTAVFAGESDEKLEVDVESIELMSPSVAIERGTAIVTRPGGETETTEYSAVHVKQGGQWLLDRVSEASPPEPPHSNYEHLKDLEWMIGSWIDQDEQASIQTDCAWTKNKNFLTRSFAVVTEKGVNMAGVQIIGWDPAQKRLRSWLFDSNGSFGDGVWNHKNDQWVIESAITLPDGGKSTAVNIMKPIDNDSFTWQSINRQVDGELLPNVPEVLIVRATDDGAQSQ